MGGHGPSKHRVRRQIEMTDHAVGLRREHVSKSMYTVFSGDRRGDLTS
jgi:hypothetical protein